MSNINGVSSNMTAFSILTNASAKSKDESAKINTKDSVQLGDRDFVKCDYCKKSYIPMTTIAGAGAVLGAVGGAVGFYHYAASANEPIKMVNGVSLSVGASTFIGAVGCAAVGSLLGACIGIATQPDYDIIDLSHVTNQRDYEYYLAKFNKQNAKTF